MVLLITEFGIKILNFQFLDSIQQSSYELLKTKHCSASIVVFVQLNKVSL